MSKDRKDGKAAKKARADSLRSRIDDLTTATDDQASGQGEREDSPGTEPQPTAKATPKGARKESPREFVQRRMRELGKKR
jgi:hypothetical protein